VKRARRAGTFRKWLSELESGKATIQLDRIREVLAALALHWQLLPVERARTTPAWVEGERGLTSRSPVDLDALFKRFVDVADGEACERRPRVRWLSRGAYRSRARAATARAARRQR
jgi:transcriptional regulator with XRE-family HTH domain